MPSTPINSYAVQGLQPAHSHREAHKKAVRLAEGTYTRGQVVGEVQGTNEVQSLSIDATGGTFTAIFGGQATAATAYNASAATLQANLEALVGIGTGNVAVTKGSTVYTLTHSSGTDAGTFGLEVTVGDHTARVTSIAWNETAANIVTALVALPNVGTGGVTASGSAGGPYTLTFAPALLASGQVSLSVVNDDTNDGGVWEGGVACAALAQGTYLVTFQNDLGYRDVAAMTTNATSLTGGAGTATVATVTAGSGYANEQQFLTRSGTVSGGTYTLAYSGQTTSAIAYDATAATVQAALIALSNIGIGDVSVTGTAATALVVTFQGALAGTNVGALTVDNTGITGGGTVVVATAVGGTGASGTHRAFDATGTDGRQKARAVLEFDVTVDSSGRHYWAATAVHDFGAYHQTAPAWVGGYFFTGAGGVDLAEAHLASNPAWHMVEGNVPSGVVKI